MFNFLKKVEKIQEVQKNTFVQRLPLTYPSGTFIETEEGVYYINGKYRYKVISDKMLATWHPLSVCPSTEHAASLHKKAGKIGFRNGTLITNIADNKTYLISDSKKRHITNPRWLDILGLGLHDAILVSDEEAKFHADGEVLD